MVNRTLELLESVMAGHEMTVSELDSLLQDRTPEDLHLEYKHGNELKDKRKGSATIRQYLSGFANSVGGILLIGVDEESWCVTGCSAPGGGDLAKWASDTLLQQATFFSPPPRFHVIDHPNGKVLVAATLRSLALVPSVEAGRTVYYLRFHDKTPNNQTLQVPEYLMSDILLGRRQQPYLYITDLEFLRLQRMGSDNTGEKSIHFILTCRIENRSLSWSESIRIGLLAFSRPTSSTNTLISSHLLSYVDIDESKLNEVITDYKLIHSTSDVSSIGPFDVQVPEFTERFVLPVNTYEYGGFYTWKGALYIRHYQDWCTL